MSKPVFKQNNQGEILLFPPRLDQNISAHHLVRVINRIVDKMDISDLLAGYKGGGTSSYHPRMLLKVLLYAYCMKIYTGRKIANGCFTRVEWRRLTETGLCLFSKVMFVKTVWVVLSRINVESTARIAPGEQCG